MDEEERRPYYPACGLCKFKQVYGTHGSIDFCRREFPNSDEEAPSGLSLMRMEVGCHLWESNGESITREEYKDLISDDYPMRDNVLRTIPRDRLNIA